LATPLQAYHYPWSVAILGFIEQKPLYDAINKRIPVWGIAGAGQTSTTVPPAYGSAGLFLLHSQQIPAFRCPSDNTFNGPADMPKTMMWSNYAASRGVTSASYGMAQNNPMAPPTSAAPIAYRGIFNISDFSSFAAIRDGSSQTIACAEVTVGSVANNFTAQPNFIAAGTPVYNFGPSPTTTPVPPFWYTPGTTTLPAFPLSGGTGKPRFSCFSGSQSAPAPAPMVFRSLFVALTTSFEPGAPCATGTAGNVVPYQGANQGACGSDVVAGGGAFPANVMYGMAPVYDALWPPNSDWPGPDSYHPGAVIAMFGDGHTQTIQQNISFQIWASLNTKAGSETINGDF
jgi:hypothetical protein